MDGASFLADVAQILVPTLQPGDMVIADNLAAHTVDGVRHAIEAAARRCASCRPTVPTSTPSSFRASHEARRCRYGSPRVHEDLIDQGVPISRKRVVRLMQAEGLKARVRKRFRCTTMSEHDQPVAANVLGQNFVAEAPNQRWVGDTTEFVIGSSGKLYLAAILDLYSRFVVGWAVSAINDRHLVIKALQMAVKRRQPAPVSCITPIRAAPMRARITSGSLRPVESRAV